MAIDELLDEHEQSERVLQWLRNNALGLLGGIALGLGAIGGWKWWQHQATQEKLAEADRYAVAVEAIDAGQPNAAELGAGLQPGMLSTLAALELAKSQAAAGEADKAIATLQGIQEADPALKSVIDQRQARLLIDAGKAAEAARLMAAEDSASGLEVLGDAHYALGDHAAARGSYEKALAKMDVGSPLRRLLELKLTEVGGTPAEDEAKS
ncbi:YfgM family protein [Marilutibacter aestuarii]|uniref:Ancillary SecYEG translocon subunit n=1 Tax=Marilutibacter aestuarii TaxID=1706195 RepID=A0A508ACS8_9GAMM|nr:tetratricopeptide repeat protein [Lysobacter aestuarii]TQD46371.1 tetratricopeptide repeat protein [Lysobacter aestuarii]